MNTRNQLTELTALITEINQEYNENIRGKMDETLEYVKKMPVSEISFPNETEFTFFEDTDELSGSMLVIIENIMQNITNSSDKKIILCAPNYFLSNVCYKSVSKSSLLTCRLISPIHETPLVFAENNFNLLCTSIEFLKDIGFKSLGDNIHFIIINPLEMTTEQINGALAEQSKSNQKVYVLSTDEKRLADISAIVRNNDIEKLDYEFAIFDVQQSEGNRKDVLKRIIRLFKAVAESGTPNDNTADDNFAGKGGA